MYRELQVQEVWGQSRSEEGEGENMPSGMGGMEIRLLRMRYKIWSEKNRGETLNGVQKASYVERSTGTECRVERMDNENTGSMTCVAPRTEYGQHSCFFQHWKTNVFLARRS